MKKQYDYCVVGSGLFGAVFANEAHKHGKSVIVVEKRKHIGGNCYTENIDGIEVHKYGAHIFRTSSRAIWDYIRQFADFNHFINSPIANYHGKIYNLPFNMNTFNKIWGCVTPKEALRRIEEGRSEVRGEPKNLEEKAISLVGREVYELLIKDYTEKQWGRKCSDLPASIIRRLPVRLTYDNNYFRDPYQGIPIGGYTRIIEKMLQGCDVVTATDFIGLRTDFMSKAKKVLFTGPIDEYYDYCLGPLEYRSLRFEHEKMACDNYQGVAVVNYTGDDVPYTRTIEHKHFVFGEGHGTVVSKEFPCEWNVGMEPYYPINDSANQRRYEQYAALSKTENHVIFGGRLGMYSYTDMQDTIANALHAWEREARNEA